MVKISDEEVEFLWGITDEKEAAEKLLDEFGIRLAMITIGPKGAYLAEQNGAAYAKCPEVKPIDTTGAGDIFGRECCFKTLKDREEAGRAGEWKNSSLSASLPARRRVFRQHSRAGFEVFRRKMWSWRI